MDVILLCEVLVFKRWRRDVVLCGLEVNGVGEKLS